MSRAKKGLTLLLAALLVLSAAAWWYLAPHPAQLQRLTLADGEAASLAKAWRPGSLRILLVNPQDAQLDDQQLLSLADGYAARVLQVTPPAGSDCAGQAELIQAASARLGGQLDVVAGIGKGGNLAWRWLAGQGSDAARALSVGFDVTQPDCSQALPTAAAHGQWRAAWNDNPGDETGRFTRAMSGVQTTIADYSTALPTLLWNQLHLLLAGQGGQMPTIEVPASGGNDTLVLFYSGDGGWRDLDRDSSLEMAHRGQPVIGVDTLRYFWQHKSAEQAASDLSALLAQEREKGFRHFVLAGYSFGADVMPAIYNRLPAADQQSVSALLLLALARSGSFEIEVQGWLGKDGAEADTAPELARIPAAKLFCVYGAEEAADSGCTLPQMTGERLLLGGGHHFDGDYKALAGHLLEAIAARRE